MTQLPDHPPFPKLTAKHGPPRFNLEDKEAIIDRTIKRSPGQSCKTLSQLLLKRGIDLPDLELYICGRKQELGF